MTLPRRFALLLLCIFSVLRAEEIELEYAPSPVDNPLRGMVPYLSAAGADRFPHSMRFSYVSMTDLMPREGEFDWEALEKILEECRAVGCQLVFRVYLEYPGKESGVPYWLLEKGVSITEWTGEEGTINRTPDYEHPALRSAISDLIRAMGGRYDGDPRIGYITAGILGRWGEWHNYPREELFASKDVQEEVLDAYEESFAETPVLLRYPAGPENPRMAKTAGRAFGYHDDSFAWATLQTGRTEDSWFFLQLMENAGTLDAWKRHPIGGELRPELWETSFTGARHPKGQDFVECVKRTHATWLMDSGLFDPRFPLPEERKENAIEQVGRLGYEFHIAKLERHGRELVFHVENRGVAPFYRNWEVVVDAGAERRRGGLLTELLPGEKSEWRFEFDKPVSGPVRIGIPNPMKGGKSLRLANRETEGDWTVTPISD